MVSVASIIGDGLVGRILRGGRGLLGRWMQIKGSKVNCVVTDNGDAAEGLLGRERLDGSSPAWRT